MPTGVYPRTKEIREKMSRMARGKKHLFRKGHSGYWKGKKHSLEHRRKNSLAQQGNKRTLGRSWTSEHKQKISKTLLRLVCEGKRKIPQFTEYKCGWYVSITAGKVFLRSSYEFVVAKWLDRRNIPWEYEAVSVPYIGLDSREHMWLVDFHRLDCGGRYHIETKGWISKTDKIKFKTFRKNNPNKILRVVTGNDLWMFRS